MYKSELKRVGNPLLWWPQLALEPARHPFIFQRIGAVAIKALERSLSLAAGRQRPVLLDSEALDRELGNLRRFFDASLTDLDDLLCDHLGERIVAVHKRKRA
jgi:hypothetical protein